MSTLRRPPTRHAPGGGRRPTFPGRRRWPLAVAAAALVATVFVAAVLVAAFASVVRHRPVAAPPVPVVVAPERCSFGAVDLSPEQASNAAVIVGVGRRLGLPEQASVIAVATALQESSLVNLDHGDRDSLGLFQQRPSQGWGTPDQLRDPVYAAERFYHALADVPRYADLPVAKAAQDVQRSAAPDAYATREADARTITAALSHATVACTLHTMAAVAGVAPLRCQAEQTPGEVDATCTL